MGSILGLGGQSVVFNCLQDGVALRLRPDVMSSFTEALSTGQNFIHESSTMKFIVEWVANDSSHNSVGGLISPIDNCALIVCS